MSRYIERAHHVSSPVPVHAAPLRLADLDPVPSALGGPAPLCDLHVIRRSDPAAQSFRARAADLPGSVVPN